MLGPWRPSGTSGANTKLAVPTALGMTEHQNGSQGNCGFEQTLESTPLRPPVLQDQSRTKLIPRDTGKGEFALFADCLFMFG